MPLGHPQYKSNKKAVLCYLSQNSVTQFLRKLTEILEGVLGAETSPVKSVSIPYSLQWEDQAVRSEYTTGQC